ncbi:hypothetical protein HK096_006776, partial [Nowakowskiella sp. JEL0078]
HFGASKVTLKNGGKRFPSILLAQNSLQRLSQISLFGNDKLKLKPVLLAKNSKRPDEKITQTPIVSTPSFAPLSKSLGLIYPPNPTLLYKYPPPTPVIISKISNAIMSIPKLYTQVLHLMNKMNLPPPFTEDQSFPILADAESNIDSATIKKRKVDDLLASDESELESESGSEKTVGMPKKSKISTEIGILKNDQQIIKLATSEPKLIFRSDSIRLTEETNFADSTDVSVSNQPNDSREDNIVCHKASGIDIPEVETSNVIYVKNLHKSMTQTDIENIFGKYCTITKRLQVQHLTKGKLKGQAFITYETKDEATRALSENGTRHKYREISVMDSEIQCVQGSKKKIG